MITVPNTINGYEVLRAYVMGASAVILAYREDKDEWVISTITDDSLKNGEWYQGHYLRDFVRAAAKFAERMNYYDHDIVPRV